MKYLLLTIFWIAMIILAYPIGEFPLNDDWAYCKDVSILLHQGRVEIVNWSAMTLVSQIFLGAFWCKLFGFSFIGLRILTMLVGLLGLFVSYKLLKKITLTEKTALFCTIVIAINPLFFNLSNSFMTDVYFYTISTIAVFFFHKAILSDKIRDIALATVFILIAILIRQIGIVIAASFALTYLYQAKSFDKNILAKALIPLFLGGLTLYLYSLWAAAYQADLQTYVSTGTAVSILGKNTLMHIFNRIGTTGLMMSLFLSPLLVLCFPHFWSNFLKKENRIALYITAICIIPLIRAWKHFPLGNVLYNFGLGPKLLKDAEMQKLNFDFTLPPFAINTVRTFCFAGALMIFYYCFSFIINCFKQKNHSILAKENTFTFFSFLNIIFLFGTFIIPDFFFDRYLVQMILPFMIVLIPYLSSLTANLRNTYFAFVIACLIGVFSVVATYDFFECNRTRWQAINYLLNDLKASPREIDGGFEFNGWLGTKYEDDPSNPTKSWWFVTDDKYMLSFSPMEGYEIIKKFPYKQYLVFGTGYIYVSKKMPLTYRLPAEFEPQEAVWIAFPNIEHRVGFSNQQAVAQIILNLLPYTKVNFLAPSDSALQVFKVNLPDSAWKSPNFKTFIAPYQEFWLRDMGPQMLETSTSGRVMLDLNFNSWGYTDSLSVEKDESLDENIANQLKMKVLSTSMIHEGGNTEVNGKGTLLMVETVEKQRNPNMTLADMEAEWKRVAGIKKIIWLKKGVYEDDFSFDSPINVPNGQKAYTVMTTGGHIDEFCRFADEHTILLADIDAADLKDDPVAVENKRRIDENYEILKKATDQDGNPFRIIRVPSPITQVATLTPKDWTYQSLSSLDYANKHIFPKGKNINAIMASSYLNFLISNEVVLAQKYYTGNNDLKFKLRDEQAFVALQTAFPNKKIVMLDNAAVNWGGGGIHCITMQQSKIKVKNKK